MRALVVDDATVSAFTAGVLRKRDCPVADTGIGIPEGDLPNLFRRFFRASNATSAAIPGTGLGLAIVQDIVLQHGGELGIASKVGEGTTATVQLPATR